MIQEIIEETGEIPVQVRYCTVRYSVIFGEQNTCGNRAILIVFDKVSSLPCGRGLYFIFRIVREFQGNQQTLCGRRTRGL
jgi:hypothetical protein